MRISDWSSDVCSSDLKVNENAAWRKIIGKAPLDKHQKDIELILRTLAISTRADEYEKPMKEFLNVTMKQYKNAESMEAKSFFNNFPKVCDIVFDKLGEKPFNIKAKINASARSEEHTSELQSLMRTSYAVFCLKQKKITTTHTH